MAIPSRQIGWGTEENLLWQISKQLETLTNVIYNSNTTTTSTTTAIPSFALVYYSGSYSGGAPCSGSNTGNVSCYTSSNDPIGAGMSQLFQDAALTIPTVMSNGTGYYTFSYDGGVTTYSCAFDGSNGQVLSGVTSC